MEYKYNYLKKLPERQKDPETCCGSTKQGKKYINPWPSATPRAAAKNSNIGSEFLKAYIKNAFVEREKNTSLKVDLDLKSINEYHEDDKNIAMQLTWLGHAAFLLQINTFTILFDPFLSGRASPISFAGPYRCRGRGFKKFSELPPIDFVILSHNHYDHLDKKTIKEIYADKRNKKRTQVFCPLDLKKWFVGIGIPEKQVTECDWWDEHEVIRIPESVDITNEEAINEALNSSSNRKITICTVPNQHFSGRTGSDNNETLWAGWVIKSQDITYYFAGDTGYRSLPDICPEEEIENYPYCPVFKQIGNIHGPFDIACIPVGPVIPPHMMSVVHTTAGDAVNIHLDCKSKHSIAMHWGTVENLGVDNIESGPAELREALDKKNIPHEEFHDVYIGQIIKLEKKN
ncbi:Metallo-hydrolase/oxidoreductase [Anaeromyces robustus]|uniref:Metallo-hydrolase/oxidoreductase n=1 Tax=Anaeromyces robustus TaxID=1754192 RepID=A0A1Y1XCW6_9FUNG|nr:Metallo-hydrolase/oxidoreductase [Anaeromyces robustus]|eukprot:ORX83563.1 Metallo-hydrolase/oxidoreductase [Anaeromyces robustus]